MQLHNYIFIRGQFDVNESSHHVKDVCKYRPQIRNIDIGPMNHIHF